VTNATSGTSGGERRGIDGFLDDLTKQRALMGDDSPVYLRALTALRVVLEGPSGDSTVLSHLQRCWRTRSFHAYYERPLLLLAALRHEALVEGKRHPLFDAFGSDEPDLEVVTRERLIAAFSPERLSFWLSLATRRVQTNEVTRGVVWRWPAYLAGCDGGKRPLALADIGAAAGLNLISDRLDTTWTDAAGKPLAVAKGVDCRARVGFDPHPLDVRFDEDLLWLRACIWPGQTERIARFDAAALAMRGAYTDDASAPVMQSLHAGLVPARLEAMSRKLAPEVFILAYQSFVRGYIEPDRSEHYVRGMQAWLASMPPGRAAWVELEIAGDKNMADPAALVVHARVSAAEAAEAAQKRVGAGAGAGAGVGGVGGVGESGGDVRSFRMARCGYHPRSVTPEPAVVRVLERVLALSPAPVAR
jgi:hypothetical protein